MKVLLRIYDFFLSQRLWLWSLLAVLTVGLGFMAVRLRYHEDILDFLEADREYTESMQVYSSLSEASRIVVIFEGQNPDSLCMAIDALAEKRPDAITEVDFDGFISRLAYIYQHLPYYLSETVYAELDDRFLHADSLLAEDRRMLSMPGSSFLAPAVASDPLRLIPLSRGASGQYAGASSAFQQYDGYMMTTDCRMAFAFVDSPYGSTESARNALLVDSLQHIAEELSAGFAGVQVRLLGSPVVAVGNARRIKRDSILAIAVSFLLIAALLLYSFPRKRDMLLILLTVSFGWLCGMAALWLCCRQVSFIVLGIGGMLVGIAVNYPLHLLVHQRYTDSVRQTLIEVLQPLVVGNITTIGAFLALIPLHSPALRQLGIFASALFVGTIVFSVLFLPHLMSAEPAPVREIRLPFRDHLPQSLRDWLRSQKAARVGYSAFGAVMLLCALLLICRPTALFDSNISHINYMTAEQRADFAYFESLSPVSDEDAYLVSSAREELAARQQRWSDFWSTCNADSLAGVVREAAVRQGFRAEAVEPFCQAIHEPAPDADLQDTETLAKLWPGRFDTEGMNRLVADGLSGNFNYLGAVCSVIVLLFLCLSFRSVVLGLIAFLPMVLSWVLIFALMQLLGLQFNIVNVILATFIFGQGDDYTIFVLEGLLYEKRTGRPMLPQYKQSILLSALIMLLAIGVLVFAQHPAMHSLGAVTLVGMSCVVLMAIVVPPMLLNLVLKIPFLRNRILNTDQ